MANYHQGFFKPRNPQKYKGDPTNIRYRSGWERKFMNYADLNSAIIQWSSEEIIIPYRSPIDGRVHRYFPDFMLKVRTKSGTVEKWIVEIKPEKQTREPKPQARKTKRYLNEVKTYAINKYKWDYAIEWCKDRGYKFIILTEKHLSIK